MSAEICHTDLMHATPGKLFSARGWIYELKHDGFRCLVKKRGDAVRLESRSGRDMSDRFPELVAEIQPIPRDFIADSELVVLDTEGRSVWERLHARHRLQDPAKIKHAAASEPAVIFAFDLLWLDGADLRARALLQRKDALHRMLPANRRIRYAAHVNDDCSDLWQLANAMDLEGIVAKRGDSFYSAGRSDYWQKVKTMVGAERERERRQ
jgi:bifunctional non-homologous end joining protein LigD